MYTDAHRFSRDTRRFCIFHDNVAIDGTRIEVPVERAGAIVRHRPEEGRVQTFVAHRPAVFPHFEVFADEAQHHRVNGNKPDLVTFTLHSEMHDALAALHIAQTQQAQLLAADAMIEQGSEYRAVPYTLQRVRGRGLQQSPDLRVTERRRTALIVVGGRPLHSVHRIAEDGVTLTEIIEQRGKRRELAANARGSKAPGRHVFAPGDHMRARHRAQRAVIFQVGEGDEFRDINFIGASRFRIGDVGEPFELGRNIREVAVLFRRQ